MLVTKDAIIKNVISENSFTVKVIALRRPRSLLVINSANLTENKKTKKLVM